MTVYVVTYKFHAHGKRGKWFTQRTTSLVTARNMVKSIGREGQALITTEKTKKLIHSRAPVARRSRQFVPFGGF